MLLADFGYNPAAQVYTVLAESLEGDTRDQVMRLLRGRDPGLAGLQDRLPRGRPAAVDMYPDAGLDLETQQVQAEVQLDIMYSDVTDEFGFAWFTDESIPENLALFAELGITGADETLWDRSLLEEIYADGPTRSDVTGPGTGSRLTMGRPGPVAAPDGDVHRRDQGVRRPPRNGPRARRRRPDAASGHGHRPRRPVRVRQVDAAADHRRPGDGRRAGR